MKKSRLALGVFLAIALFFSGTVFGEICQTYSGEDIFSITRLSYTYSEDIRAAMARGGSEAGRIAWTELSSEPSLKTELFLWSEKEGKELLASYDYGDEYFLPYFMTTSGALVGMWLSDCKTISVMFTPEEENATISRFVSFCGDSQISLFAADSDTDGLIYVLGETGESPSQLKVWIISPQGVESEIVIVDEVSSPYRVGYYGGLDIHQGTIYAVVSIYYELETSVEFLAVFEVEMGNTSQIEGYIFGWDGYDLPTMKFGELNGNNIFGQYDGLPFVYNLASRDLEIFPVCTREGGGYQGRTAIGFIPGTPWIGGGAGPELFFLNTKFGMNFIVEMPFFAGLRVLMDDGMIVYGDDSHSAGDYYYVTLKKSAKH